MKKVILIASLLFLTASIFAASNTDNKIKKSEKNLQKSETQQKEASEQLDKIAKDIKKANRDNQALNKKLEVLSEQFSQNEEAYQISKKTLVEYDQSLNTINRKIKEKKQIFIETLANQSSVIHAMNESHDPSRESIVMQEAYQLLKKQNNKELIALKQQIDDKKILKRKIVEKRSSVKNKIDKIAKERKEYEKQKITKQKLLRKLENNEGQYRNKLQKTMDKQNALRSTLADLNILQKKEVEKEKQIAAEQKAAMLAKARQEKADRKKRKLARAKARKAGKKVVYEAKPKVVASSKPSVKKRGSSYRKNKTYAYRGNKTISPIKGAKVVKKFGTYIDPIYKIKIFNESITLRAPSKNSKVHNVLNGKVVFAGSSSMLGKVVVVSHGKIHTVYAGLSKIAPNLRKGSRIKKGYVVGKVSRKLIFEATKNSKPINPLKLIRI